MRRGRRVARLDDQRHAHRRRQLHFAAQVAGGVGQVLELVHPGFGAASISASLAIG
jgi:hypothetical protein